MSDMTRKTKPRPWNPNRPTIKVLQESLASASRNVQSYMDRNRQLERELKDSLALVEELKRQANWHRQLSQNLSEAVCAYMRNR